MALRSRILVAALAPLIAAGGPGIALAANEALVDATQPDVLVELMRGFGSARLDKAEDGSPMIRGRIEGDGFSVFFYGCTNDWTECRSLGFSTSFDRKEVTMDDVNGWNRDNRFGRAYIDDDGKPVLEMDINLARGVTADNFESSLDQWTRALADFGEEVVNKDRSKTDPAPSGSQL